MRKIFYGNLMEIKEIYFIWFLGADVFGVIWLVLKCEFFHQLADNILKSLALGFCCFAGFLLIMR